MMGKKISCIVLYDELVHLQQAYRKLSWIKRAGFRLFSWNLASALANLEPTNISSVQRLFIAQKNVWILKKIGFLKKAFIAFINEKSFFHQLFNHFSSTVAGITKPFTATVLTHPKADALLLLALKFDALKDPKVFQPLLEDDALLHFVQETFDKNDPDSVFLLKQLLTYPALDALKSSLKVLLHFGFNSHANLIKVMNSTDIQQLLLFPQHTQFSVEKTLVLNDSMVKEMRTLLGQVNDISQTEYLQLFEVPPAKRKLLLELSSRTSISIALLEGFSAERMQIYRALLQQPLSSQNLSAHIKATQALENPAEQIVIIDLYQQRPILFKAYEGDAFSALLTPPKVLKAFLQFIETLETALKTKCTDERCELLFAFIHSLRTEEESKQTERKKAVLTLLTCAEEKEISLPTATLQAILQSPNKIGPLIEFMGQLPKEMSLGSCVDLSETLLEDMNILLKNVDEGIEIEVLDFLVNFDALATLLPLAPHLNNPQLRKSIIHPKTREYCLTLAQYYPEGLSFTALFYPEFAEYIDVLLDKITVQNRAKVLQAVFALGERDRLPLLQLAKQAWSNETFIIQLLTDGHALKCYIFLAQHFPDSNLQQMTQSVKNFQSLNALLEQSVVETATLKLIIEDEVLQTILSRVKKDKLKDDFIKQLAQHPAKTELAQLILLAPEADLPAFLEYSASNLSGICTLIRRFPDIDMNEILEWAPSFLHYIDEDNAKTISPTDLQQLVKKHAGISALDTPDLSPAKMDAISKIHRLLQRHLLSSPAKEENAEGTEQDPDVIAQLLTQLFFGVTLSEAQLENLFLLFNNLENTDFFNSIYFIEDVRRFIHHPHLDLFLAYSSYLDDSMPREGYELLFNHDPTINLCRILSSLKQNHLLKGEQGVRNLQQLLKHLQSYLAGWERLEILWENTDKQSQFDTFLWPIPSSIQEKKQAPPSHPIQERNKPQQTAVPANSGVNAKSVVGSVLGFFASGLLSVVRGSPPEPSSNASQSSTMHQL